MRRNRPDDFIFNWVLINELAIGNLPKTIQSIETLKKNKISSILNLCSKREFDYKETLYDSFNYKNHPLPDHKSSRPPKIEEFQEALNLASNMMSDGPLFVHCYASMERSPLICLGLLKQKEGISLQEAFDYLKQVHRNCNPLPEQLKIIDLI